MVALNIPEFRVQFPAFKDEARYPDVAITIYWEMATVFISADGCPYRTLSGKKLQLALNLLTAHLYFLAIETTKVVGGKQRGSSGGFTTSATVGDVSVAKLAPPANDGWQWWLAGSPYGQQLWALLSVLSAGGFAIGGLNERSGFRKVGGVFL